MAPKSPTLADRSRRTFRGVIDSITVAPSVAPPSFTAIVLGYPATAETLKEAGPPAGTAVDAVWRKNSGAQRIRLIWIGQRQIAGIAAGTALKFEGMTSVIDGMQTIYNPRYEIISRQEGRE